MAAIGRIRKHGVLLMIIIGVALLAFIVGDLTNVFNFGKNTVMQVGSKKIERDATSNIYDEYFQQNMEYYRFLTRNNPIYEANNEMLTEEVHRLTYAQIQHEAILDEQLQKAGLPFTDEMKKEIREKVLKNAGYQESPLYQVINHTLTEFAESDQYRSAYSEIRKIVIQALQSPEDMESCPGIIRESPIYLSYKAIEHMAIIEAKENTYFGLAVNSIHFSRKLLAQMANDNNRINGEMVSINIDHPSFDNIKVDVSESDAKTYFKEHQNRYTVRQTEKDVEIAYFTVEPSSEDRENAKALADELFQKMKSSNSIKEFTSEQAKIEKINLKYAQNSRDPYTYNMHESKVIAAYAQIDSNLYLKAGETSLQKRNQLSRPADSYSSHATPMAQDWKSIVTPTDIDSTSMYIEPKLYKNSVYYFGQVRDIAERPDTIRIARLLIPFTDSPKQDNVMNEEQAYKEALSIKDSINGKDSSALIPYLAKYGYTDTSKVIPLNLLDGASFDLMTGRLNYDCNDTLTSNLYNELDQLDTNQCYIKKYDNFYTIDMVLYKSQPVVKSQYLLYPVPILASSATDKKEHQSANSVANKNSVKEMLEEAKKKGGEKLSTTITGMQYVLQTNNGILECREAINWAFNTNKNANNEVGSVAHNPFTGHLTTYEYIYDPMTGNPSLEVNVKEVFVVIGITASNEEQSPSFDDMKERVIKDLKAEKKRDAIVERLKKEFKGTNMSEIASKYGVSSMPMSVAFSEYSMMESAAVGKIAHLTAGKNDVVSSNNFVYLVNVTSVDKADDVNKQRAQAITAAFKQLASQYSAPLEIDDNTAKNEFFIQNACRTVLLANAQVASLQNFQEYIFYRDFGGYHINDVVKQLGYNDIAGDIKLRDYRSSIYGASANR